MRDEEEWTKPCLVCGYDGEAFDRPDVHACAVHETEEDALLAEVKRLRAVCQLAAKNDKNTQTEAQKALAPKAPFRRKRLFTFFVEVKAQDSVWAWDEESAKDFLDHEVGNDLVPVGVEHIVRIEPTVQLLPDGTFRVLSDREKAGLPYGMPENSLVKKYKIDINNDEDEDLYEKYLQIEKDALLKEQAERLKGES